MRLVVVGSGGREHALAVACASSGAQVVVAPGNPGMRAFPKHEGICVEEADPLSLEADLFVIGPEAPLVAGLADQLRARGHAVVGPGGAGSRLEGSKAFMKRLVSEAGVPTAEFGIFTSVAEAMSWIRKRPAPWVIKTDGLAAGKGVLVTSDLDRAAEDLEAKLSGRAFGEAGRTVVVEEGLQGKECSVIALTDGRRIVVLPPAVDYKRLGDHDRGPNTGGMGSYAPKALNPAELEAVIERVMMPTLAGLRRLGIDYRGVLYAGLMLCEDGPKLLEFNVRFGDPETQAILPLLAPQLFVELLERTAKGELSDDAVLYPDGVAAVCVVMASPGYPERPVVGELIGGVEEAEAEAGVRVLEAATRAGPGGARLSAGGRVLDVVAVGSDLDEARSLAYSAVKKIHWPTAQFRTDIAALV